MTDVSKWKIILSFYTFNIIEEMDLKGRKREWVEKKVNEMRID